MIEEAVILAAGMGTRLASSHADPTSFSKPLLKVGERTLIGHVLAACAAVGVRRVVVVTGYKAQLVRQECERWENLEVAEVHNERWRDPNGLSVATAEPAVGDEFFLMMSDHLFEPTILDSLNEFSGSPGVTLAVDPRIESILDLEDATKVLREGDRIVAIGKDLPEYDAIDCGLFRCTRAIFPALREAAGIAPPSLSDGLKLLLRAGTFNAMEIRDQWWQDVDTPEMVRAALSLLERSRRSD